MRYVLIWIRPSAPGGPSTRYASRSRHPTQHPGCLSQATIDSRKAQFVRTATHFGLARAVGGQNREPVAIRKDEPWYLFPFERAAICDLTTIGLSHHLRGTNGSIASVRDAIARLIREYLFESTSEPRLHSSRRAWSPIRRSEVPPMTLGH